MGTKITLSDQLQLLSKKTIDSISVMETIPELYDDVAEKWMRSCQTIHEQIEYDLLKIAVVGVIKSGKSTFVNSLFGKEVVKRGAGVVTAITTRIRKGKKNRAQLFLKSWDQINNELQKALLCFPHDSFFDENNTGFDLRRNKDRSYLKEVDKKLAKDISTSDEGIRPEVLLINNAINGYDFCKDIVKADISVIEFAGRQFGKHIEFTADPKKSFYVKDVCLEIVSSKIVKGIEIADCQGSDSTDPAQVKQIQNYLESSNLIIYLISSRTGLRQADIKFLATIKSMGLLENIIFVNNCDLSEHDSLKDLQKVDNNIRNELEYLKSKPALFSFSSLYNLFSKLGPNISKKDKKKLEYWADDKKLINFCDKMYENFFQMLSMQIEKDKFDLLFSNSIERLKVISHGALKKIDLYSKLLSDDVKVARQSLGHLKEFNQSAKRLETIVSQSLVNSSKDLKKDLESNIVQFFHSNNGKIQNEISKFIHNYSFDYQKYEENIKISGVNNVIYMMFQDFRSDLDLFIAKEIHPQVISFILSLENQIQKYFDTLDDSYDLDVLKGLYSFEGVGGNDLEKLLNKREDIKALSQISGIKKILGLVIPDIVFSARYTGQVKVHAFAGFGLTSILEFFSRIAKKQNEKVYTTSLEKTALSIKNQSLKSILTQTREYQQIISEDYVTPLLEAVSRDFNDKILERFHLYGDQFENIETLFNKNEDQKKIQKKSIGILINNFNDIINSLESL